MSDTFLPHAPQTVLPRPGIWLGELLDALAASILAHYARQAAGAQLTDRESQGSAAPVPVSANHP